MTSVIKRYRYLIFTVVFFSILFLLSVNYLLHQAKTFTDTLIADDIAQLQQIFTKIDDECKIFDFEHQKNHIDFLTVEKFVGSEIGAMNLTFPRKWQGPYIEDNPTIQEKLYQVVRTKKGFFITPGDGVKLANGKIVGKDIILDEDADIAALANDPQQLMFKGRSLAAKIKVSGARGPKLLDVLATE